MIPYVTDTPDIRIPPELLPVDGRFGSGPSKVRPEQVARLAEVGGSYLGTSHRQPTVRHVVGRVRAGLAELFSLPDGYEVALGNGGTTCFWDAATFGLIDRKSQHLAFGEFSSKFAAAAKAAPHLDDPHVIESPAGTHPLAVADESIDLYALTHNETSTGVAMQIERPRGHRSGPGRWPGGGGRHLGGWRAVGRPDPVRRLLHGAPEVLRLRRWHLACPLVAGGRRARRSGSTRRVAGRRPPSIWPSRVENSRLNQTYNTPALATLFLLAEQLDWMLKGGGLPFTSGRCDDSAEILYTWAERSGFARPFVERPSDRSHVVGTIDFVAAIDAATVAKVLRANGILDTEPYRKLGRNQLRIAMFPAIDPEDVAALCACVTHVVGALA